jgi:hypothetical protein
MQRDMRKVKKSGKLPILFIGSIQHTVSLDQGAQFKHTKTGAYMLNEGKGGINWYRYQEKILEPLLLPFAKECLKKRPGTLVQEDKAPAHASQYQQEVLEIQRLL